MTTPPLHNSPPDLQGLFRVALACLAVAFDPSGNLLGYLPFDGFF